MKILIIEDEKNLVKILKMGLEENGFTVDLANDGEEGLYLASEFPCDAIILDLSLPKLDGLGVLRRLREKQSVVPVLILTARGEVSDKIKGLNSGADDYLAKPFDFVELLARINALIRRSKGKPSPEISIGDLVINTNSHLVERGGKNVKLSANEYSILEYLAFNHDRVISRTELTEHLYNIDFDNDSNVIDVYINFLRNKLDKGFAKPLINTVRGAGYILSENYFSGSPAHRG